MVTQSFSSFAKLAQLCITKSVSKVKALSQEGHILKNEEQIIAGRVRVIFTAIYASLCNDYHIYSICMFSLLLNLPHTMHFLLFTLIIYHLQMYITVGQHSPPLNLLTRAH